MAETTAQTTLPTLHNLSSSAAHRVLWTLEELAEANGLQYKLINTPRRSVQDLKAVFPLGKSPILTLEPFPPNSTLTQTHQMKPNILTESRLILQFLSDTYSNGLWTPSTEEDRRRDVFFQEFANATLLTKADFAMLFEVLALFMPWGIRHLWLLGTRPIVNHFKGDWGDIFELMEGELSEEKPWFAGGRLGLSDFNMSFGMETAAQRGYFDAGKYPKLAGWLERVSERPAKKRALEKGGAYDLVRFA